MESLRALIDAYANTDMIEDYDRHQMEIRLTTLRGYAEGLAMASPNPEALKMVERLFDGDQ